MIGAPLPQFWDLSPDGQWIALGWGDRIRLLSLAGRPPRDISVDGWGWLQCVAWAANGKAVFATAHAPKDPPLLRISLDGEVTLLHKGLFNTENPVPSPDGRYLAFGKTRWRATSGWWRICGDADPVCTAIPRRVVGT